MDVYSKLISASHASWPCCFCPRRQQRGKTWEYLVKTYPLLGNDGALTQTLNKLGEQQWELVNCAKGSAKLTCIFKRPAKGA